MRNASKIRIDGDLKTAIETGRNRLVIAGALFVAAFGLIGLRLVDVAVLKDDYEPRQTRNVARDESTVGRADVTDRNGVLLATSLTTASLYANPRLVVDPEQAARRLAAALPDVDVAEVEAKLRADRAFVWLRRHLTPRQQYAVNRLGIPALNFQREERRIYPMGPLAAHVLGFTDIDSRGLAGVERYFDKDLRSRRDRLELALDVRVQHIVERELAAAMETFGAIGAAGLVMDVRSGEVIAMASLPAFDPNRPGEIGEDLRFNRATLGVYEMGSTFKIFTTAMALDAGTVKMTGGYDATDPIRVARFVIRDYHAKKRWLSVPEIFMYSSNIGSVKMAMDVGVAGHRAFLGELGLLRAAPVELHETADPLLPARWHDINTMTISFGHGLAVSPLQLAAGVAAIVNGGIYRAPTLLRGRPGDVRIGRRVVSEQTSFRMRRLMRLVVEQGTGSKAAAPGYVVGGKTGTAEKVSGRGYHRKSLMSSFVAAFPMQAPRYVVLVMLDEPKGTKETFGYATGGWVAAPAVSRVIRRAAPLLGVRPVEEDSDRIRTLLSIELPEGRGEERRVAAH